ncbi:glutamate-1-semialdehyde 2,1-aminomutase [Canicola haemoglobinophilus]|uniref:Glutamate-1-semialdehyde 2,1-aminomutase n=1 Tax=Canicola haemoglobinophilus TaxID=733 RepID=A0AB38H8G1_9PAST|nr:virulence RhuM family protein [Canicola haemoglobinophilus]STO54669.1 glutamate-1-semialdehyde 2,1-aminomutase [Canicola haemoglobinophilus]STO67556.1 glutamate-1-semialdehyde 2,1-aminomutase [Canicola haemoglobinophilus]
MNKPPKSMVVFKSIDGLISVNVQFDEDTAWLSLDQMASLFDRDKSTISRHINNIFQDGELERNSVVAKFATTAADGKTYQVDYFNLDVIISVGYRVKSLRGTQFRIWATKVLKEYMLKGFALDDERLKQGNQVFGKDYFRELLDRVRSIRASERRIWQQITDIYAECSSDYNPNAAVTKAFYAMVQNKFHFAITGQTAAEIIYTHADHHQQNMGLKTWKNAPDGRILSQDVMVAKNYLNEKQIRQLERAVTGYFDYIEDLIERENLFDMQQFANSVDEFLAFRRYDILPDKGKISSEAAKEKAKAEYAIFNRTQKIVSDFDKVIQKLNEK